MTQEITLNGTIYSDDGSVGRGMDEGGFRENFIPMCGDLMVEMSETLGGAEAEVVEATNQALIATNQANIAIGAAASTVTGPGSTGTSTTSMMVGLGVKNFTMQPGKTLYKGMPIVIAASASPDDAMYGPLESYDPATGATVVKVSALHMKTPGVFIAAADWTVSLTGVAAVWALINELKGAPIASAASMNLDAATGNYLHITGSTGPITAVTLAQGAERQVTLDSTPTFVNSANLILPTGANIVGAAGDVVTFRGEGAGVTRVTGWQRANGDALFAPRQFRTVTYMTMSGPYVAPGDGELRITLRGADGSGAIAVCSNDSAASAVASGGAAGGLAVKTLRVKAGDTFTGFFAAGGAQVSTVTSPTNGLRFNGNPGGDSSVIGPNVNLTAAGGAGGIGAFVATGPVTAVGAVGGAATGGDENYTGGNSGTAAVTVGSGVAATGGGAVGWNGAGFSSGNATVSAPTGNPAGAASGGAGTGGPSGAATASNAATGAPSGGAGAAGASPAATNAQSADGPGLPAMLTCTPLSLKGAGSTVEAGAGGRATASSSSGGSSVAGGQLAGGGAAVCFGNNTGPAPVIAVGGAGGSTGGAAARSPNNGQTTVTAQAGANAFAIFEWTKA